MSEPFVLGTRGSALALAQVELVKRELKRVRAVLNLDVRKITTSGDRSQHATAWIESGAGLKGMFTKEIEDALLAKKIDVAVHSCKDLPGRLAQGCAVRAVLERAPTDDILLSKTARSFTELPPGARIATSSVRRRRQLRWMRGDLVVEEIRGNVPTRVQKLCDSETLDGIVLARAGLARLDFDLSGLFAITLPTLPAIGQGAIALECRDDDKHASEILDAINHAPTFQCIRAERELLRLLDGDCRLPVGAKTEIVGDLLRMKAIVFGDDDQPPRTGEAEGELDGPEKIAAAVFQQLTF